METIHNFIKSEVPKYVRGSVLDVGGGQGRWKSILVKYSTEYFISDLYSKEADFKDDARKLSNRSGSFDTVVSFETLEHIDDTEAVVREMYRVLKPGGHLVLTIPFIFPNHGNPNDYVRFTPNGLEFYFKRVGFQIINSGRIGNILTVLGIYCKYKVKNYSRSGRNHYPPKYLFLILQRVMLFLSRKFPYDGEDYFTHSFVIVKK